MKKINNVDNHLLSILYSLEGKMNKKEFNQIKKFYNWKLDFKKVHIVGTNGKGSNAKYINDELIAQGYNVGLFTSPHLLSMYERIKVNNNNIDFESMTIFVSSLKSNFPNINFGWFDVFFLTSIYFFTKWKVDVAIFEAGIGARKDVVNYLNHDYVLITSINLDHQKLLGNTIEKIAIDKSYAIKKNTNIFISDAINKKCIDIFKDRAKKLNANLKIVKTKKTTFETINISLSKFFLLKEFNVANYKSFFILPKGRAEKIIFNNFVCYLDVAHNEEGFEKSIQYYKKHNINFEQIVVSLSSDKDKKKIFAIVEKNFNTIFIYENRGRKPLKLFEYDKKYKVIFDLQKFLKEIKKKTLFIGSFYLISEILEMISNKEVESQNY